ncbi:unnamed protein product [Pieris brassicae]|uniref:Myrosinase 1-like n=1 Tax=Pieris brassicae TaxID=7116 RepID=A0A9P0T8Y6_PIEBR|nr:unnamed protein product [Pieris brassicae]
MIFFAIVVFRVVNGEAFPDGFKFGAATSAYQIEGARSVSDNGVNIWDTYTHNHPEFIADRATGDVACDSYHLWMKDIDIAEQLGLDFYRVRTWVTINEPLLVCDYIYTSGTLAPGILEPTFAPYLCNKYVLLAHAKAWRIYDNEYKRRYQGKLSIAINPVWIEPSTPQFKDLAELGQQFGAGRYSYPIYSKTGGWPPSVEKYMKNLSKKEGYSKSRLPEFTHEEIKLIRGTYDYYALNHYTSRLIRPTKPGETAGAWNFYGSTDLDAVLESPPWWPPTAATEVVMYPKGIRKQLEWLQQQYGNISFLITENGCASGTKGQYDFDRIIFIGSYLKEILNAIRKGIKVEGYTAWSLMDNFEWLGGYRTSYGLYKVDFENPMRKRTPRNSARFYADVIKTRRINFIFNATQSNRKDFIFKHKIMKPINQSLSNPPLYNIDLFNFKPLNITLD